MTISASDALTIENKETVPENTEQDGVSLHEQEPHADSAAHSLIIFWICLMIVLSTLAFGTVHTWSLSLFYCSAVLLSLFWIVDALHTKKLQYNNSPLQLPLVGVFLLGVIQLLPFGGQQLIDGALNIPQVRTITQDPNATRMALIQIAAITIFFAASLAFIDRHKRLRAVTNTIIIFGFLLAVQGLIQKFSSPTKIYWIREPNQAFPFGPFINSGHFAACMEMTLSLTLGVLFGGGVAKDLRVLYGFMAFVMFVAMVMTGSRGAFLVSIVIVVLLLLAKNLLHRNIDDEDLQERRLYSMFIKLFASIGVGILTIGIVLTLIFSFGGSAAIERIFNYTDANHPAGGGRIHYWTGALQIIKDHPIFGVGLEGFGVAFTKYDTLDGSYRIERAHNDYLQVLTDTGLIGALCALAFIVLLFRYGLNCYKNSHDKFRRGVCLGALIGCVAVLLHSFFEFPLRTTSNAFLFLILATLATVEIHKETKVRKYRKSRRRRHQSDIENQITA